MPVLDAPAVPRCSACHGPRCDHDDILRRLLGCGESGLCLDCLAFAFGLEPRRFAHGAVNHLRKKACLWLEFDRVRSCGCRLEAARSAS